MNMIWTEHDLNALTSLFQELFWDNLEKAETKIGQNKMTQSSVLP